MVLQHETENLRPSDAAGIHDARLADGAVPFEGSGLLAFLSSIGFGCFIGWDRLMFNSALTLNVPLYNHCPVLAATYLVGMLLMLLLVVKRDRLVPWSLLLVCSVVAVLTGAGLCLSNDATVIVVCAAFQGLASIPLMVGWGSVLVRQSARTAGLQVAISFACALLLVWAARYANDLAMYMDTLLPLVSSICLLAVLRNAGVENSASHDDVSSATPLLADHALQGAIPHGSSTDLHAAYEAVLAESFPWPYLSVFSLCSILAAFFCGVVVNPYIINSNTITAEMTIISCIAMAGLALFVVFSHASNLNGYFFCLLAFLVIGLLLFSVGILQSLILPIAMIAAVYNCLAALAWVELATLVRKRDLDVSSTFVTGMMLLNGVIPLFAGVLLTHYLSMSFALTTGIATVCIAVFAIFYIVSSQLHAAAMRRAAQRAVTAVNAVATAAPANLTTEQTVYAIDAQSRRVAELYGFTDRETEVFELLMRGMNGPAIAEKLVMSPSTVKFHTSNIYKKCDVHSRAELAMLVKEL